MSEPLASDKVVTNGGSSAPATATAPGSATPSTNTKTASDVRQGLAHEAAPAESKIDPVKPPAPEIAYDFKKPDGYTGTDSDVSRIKDTAKALGLSVEQAQKLFDYDAQLIKNNDEAITREMAQARADHLAQLKSDPEFGGQKYRESITKADQFLAMVDPSMELLQSLREHGLDAFPPLVRAFMRAGQMMGNGKLHGIDSAKQPATDPANIPLHEKLYPTK